MYMLYHYTLHIIFYFIHVHDIYIYIYIYISLDKTKASVTSFIYYNIVSYVTLIRCHYGN